MTVAGPPVDAARTTTGNLMSGLMIGGDDTRIVPDAAAEGGGIAGAAVTPCA